MSVSPLAAGPETAQWTHYRGLIEADEGRLPQAERLYFRAFELYRDLHHTQGLAEVCDSLARLLLRQGKTPTEVEDALVEKGIERSTVTIVVDKLTVAQPNVNKEEGTKNMMIGGLICLVSIVITAATYSAASGGGAGRKIVQFAPARRR